MTDDAATAELEILTIRHFRAVTGTAQEQPSALESDETTFDIHGDRQAADVPTLRADADGGGRTEIVERLRFDFEQVRSKWLGVQAELHSRESLARRLDGELRAARHALEQANSLIDQRDRRIAELEAQGRERDGDRAHVQARVEQLPAAGHAPGAGADVAVLHERLARCEGAVAGLRAAFGGLEDQHRRTEAYADDLRRQLNDLREESRGAVEERSARRADLEDARATIAILEVRLGAARAAAEKAEGELAAVRDMHEQEVRQLRFELTEAQETLAEQSEVSEQLACDLTENRGHRIELERLLCDQEQRSRDRIAALEKQVAHLEKTLADYERKLETKSGAISALMAELSRQSGNAAEHVDDTILLRAVPTSGAAERPHDAERTTRLLVGHVDGQEVRFPLFKNRLTIGRTPRNDIHLKADFISRRHAVIVSEGGTTRIIDWGSKNGVYVNSNRVTEHTLENGDQVLIGSFEFRYEELQRRDTG